MHSAASIASPVERAPNVVYCDGGLCNRLNALIFALILRHQFGRDWQIAWPVNNWCGAAFETLFSIDLPVTTHALPHFGEFQAEYYFLMHENQCGFRGDRVMDNHSLGSMAAYQSALALDRPILYYNNLLPPFVDLAMLKAGLSQLRVNERIAARAQAFCDERNIDERVIGLHIRKTDFGGSVDDDALHRAVSSDSRRFFVCSDDEQVNRRFAALPNCCVFEKRHFPGKLVAEGDWNASTRDSAGRVFPYNITRPGESIVEALIDLLILSRTTPARTSQSTFLGMAFIFKAVDF